MTTNPLLLDIPEELLSERLLLRVPRAGDGAVVNASVRESHAELKRWMPWAINVPEVEESEEYARRSRIKFIAREELNFLILLRDGTHVGNMGTPHLNWSVPWFEIGYWLRTSHCGHGYMTEAVTTLTDFLFGTLAAARVEIRMDDRNERSWRVAERAGFQREGTLRHDALDCANALRNTRIYSRIGEAALAKSPVS